MQRAGAHVVGHDARVRVGAGGARLHCGCGEGASPRYDVTLACLDLVLHLQAAVRGGAEVVGGEEPREGGAGVREPRRPFPPHDGGRAALDLPA